MRALYRQITNIIIHKQILIRKVTRYMNLFFNKNSCSIFIVFSHFCFFMRRVFRLFFSESLHLLQRALVDGLQGGAHDVLKALYPLGTFGLAFSQCFPQIL